LQKLYIWQNTQISTDIWRISKFLRKLKLSSPAWPVSFDFDHSSPTVTTTSPVSGQYREGSMLALLHNVDKRETLDHIQHSLPDKETADEHQVTLPNTSSGSKCTTMPPLVVTKNNDGSWVGEITTEKAERLREKCRSRKNFAWRLMPHYFKPEDMFGKTCRGSKQKEALNPDVLERLRLKVNDVCFLPKQQEPIEWRRCELAIHKGLRCSKPTFDS
jgi:hypothetical protein